MEIDQTSQARSMIRASMVEIRAETSPRINLLDRPMVTQIRTDCLDGQMVKRLIIHLHSSGCGWARKSGGCTMCGFYAATTAGLPVSSEDYVAQVTSVLERYPAHAFSIIGLYNAGNIFNDDEVPFDALQQICRLLARNPYIKRVSFESKLEYIDGEKLKCVQQILPGKEIELGIGVETLSETIRDLCINKPFHNRVLQNKIDYLLGLGIFPKAYLLFKPPFLTETEAIEDIVLSYRQIRDMGVERINIETMTIEKQTLVYRLWQNGLYRPPWLWSIIRIIQELSGARLYFTPFQYIVNAEAVAQNCPHCSSRISKTIFDYQEGWV
ncbi:MAG: hypothetical protein AAGU05_16630, partial [Anaerolineaceae bacterium]